MTNIDVNIKEALDRYIKHGISPGDFLKAVLENNLMEAIGRADTVNRNNLHAICKYIYNELPGHIHGSKEKVKNHLEGK